MRPWLSCVQVSVVENFPIFTEVAEPGPVEHPPLGRHRCMHPVFTDGDSTSGSFWNSPRVLHDSPGAPSGTPKAQTFRSHQRPLSQSPLPVLGCCFAGAAIRLVATVAHLLLLLASLCSHWSEPPLCKHTHFVVSN